MDVGAGNQGRFVEDGLTRAYFLDRLPSECYRMNYPTELGSWVGVVMIRARSPTVRGWPGYDVSGQSSHMFTGRANRRRKVLDARCKDSLSSSRESQ